MVALLPPCLKPGSEPSVFKSIKEHIALITLIMSLVMDPVESLVLLAI